MTSKNIIGTMVALVVTLIVAGVLVIQAGYLDEFLQANSNRIGIQDDATMHQLILYDTTIAYVCNDKKGGYYTASGALQWESFGSFRKNDGAGTPWTFGELEEALPAAKPLSCYGETKPFPGRGNLVGGDNWINDQEGEYSRKRFSVESDIQLGEENGCFGFKGGEYGGDDFSDTAFVFSDRNSPNKFKFGINSGKISGCKKFQGEDANHGSNLDGNWMNGGKPNVMSTVTVMTSDGISLNSDQKKNRGTVNQVSNGGGLNSHDIEKYSFKLCEGTKGYIQANTGGNKNVDGPDNNGDVAYSPDSPPGFSEKEKTGSAEGENKIHTFIVITNNGC